MTNVLVVGGAGYIGSHVVKKLLEDNFSVLVFDNLSTGHADAVPQTHLIIGDLSNIADIERCFKNNKIDIVMHFASSIAVGESVIDPAKYYRNNVVNTINLLDVMRTHSVNNIIFSSTAAVYGNPIETPISIDHPRNPINPYGKSKAMVEQIIDDYHRAYGLNYVFFRYFNAAGADPSGTLGERHDPETHLIPLALQVAQGIKKEFLLYGDDYDTNDGTCIRDYIHVCDIATAHVLGIDYLLHQKKSSCFNLGTNHGSSVAEVIACVERVTQKKITVKTEKRRAGDSPVLVADATSARKVLRWQPQYPQLERMIEDAWKSK